MIDELRAIYVTLGRVIADLDRLAALVATHQSAGAQEPQDAIEAAPATTPAPNGSDAPAEPPARRGGPSSGRRVAMTPAQRRARAAERQRAKRAAARAAKVRSEQRAVDPVVERRDRDRVEDKPERPFNTLRHAEDPNVSKALAAAAALPWEHGEA